MDLRLLESAWGDGVNMRTRTRLCAMSVLFLGCSIAPSIAAPQIYSDSALDLSVTGFGASRSCSVVFKPTKEQGTGPRLIISTGWMSQLSVGIVGAEQYIQPVIVRGNVRYPFAPMNGITSERFLGSDLMQAIKSHRLFFITAKRDGKYVSSRYENIDIEKALNLVGNNCPFDVETLMSDVSARERGERALSLPAHDLKLIRWGLNRKFADSCVEPDIRPSLSLLERGYLRRYTAEIGAPVSQYLTADVARRLSVLGAAAERECRPTPPPAPALPKPAAPPLPAPSASAPPVELLMKQTGLSYTTHNANVWSTELNRANIGKVKVIISTGSDIVVVFAIIAKKAMVSKTPQLLQTLVTANHDFDYAKIGFDKDGDLFVRIDTMWRLIDAAHLQSTIEQVANVSNELFGKISYFIRR